MFKFTPLRFLKHISISKKLYFVIGTMAVLIAVELATLWFAIQTLSAVRGLVGAEGLWSKAQKDAIYHLQKYYLTRNEVDYQEFVSLMKVPLGDHKTRLELMKEKPDFNIAREGFIEGKVHPDDIDGMIQLLRRFNKVNYIHKAITLWTKGDSLISFVTPIGDALHAEIKSPNPSQQKLDTLIGKLQPLNQRLTVLEDDFSYTLGEGSRWLENIILKLLFLVALTVEITGLILSVSITRSITRGLNAINKATDQISKGNLNAKADIFAQDEIGKVAAAVNAMTEQLVASNKELAQFAYIASHDLQEPLRTISNFVGLLQEEHANELDPSAKQYLNIISGATARMQILIKDVLDYSRIGNSSIAQQIDCNLIVKEVMNDLSSTIEESNCLIIVKPLPIVTGHAELRGLFQNLITNAIKFRKKDEPCRITISSTEDDRSWLFSVKDNGIGIEKAYFEKIFIIFQKLHSHKIYPGSGIGLAQSKKIVDLHKGNIWVESALGEGSNFHFSIPKQIAYEK